MKITPDEVRRVAVLAHLQIDDAAERRLLADLDEILLYMDKLEELDTSVVGPALGLTEERAPLRADSTGGSLPVEEALSNAPESGGGHFKVPRVIPG